MTVATDRRWSIAEYLAYADGSGDRFELVDGELFRMALGTGRYSNISDSLTEDRLLVANDQSPSAIWLDGTGYSRRN
jgi:Uma2 family endonuclease